MTFPTPQPVVSGVPYAVREVDGRTPTSLEDFIGASVAMTVEGATGTHVVRGAASRVDGVVKLYEKSDDGVGKDMRTWQISAEDDGSFCAHTL